MRGIRFISLLVLGYVAVGCVGLTNQSGAPYVDTVALSATVAKADCHYQQFQTLIAPYVESQCVSCHSGNAGGLLLGSGTNTPVLAANYTELLSRISNALVDSSQTLLLKKITTGSGVSHSFQRPTSDQLVMDFNSFAQSILSDPSCTATGVDNSGCVDANCFF